MSTINLSKENKDQPPKKWIYQYEQTLSKYFPHINISKIQDFYTLWYYLHFIYKNQSYSCQILNEEQEISQEVKNEIEGIISRTKYFENMKILPEMLPSNITIFLNDWELLSQRLYEILSQYLDFPQREAIQFVTKDGDYFICHGDNSIILIPWCLTNDPKFDTLKIKKQFDIWSIIIASYPDEKIDLMGVSDIHINHQDGMYFSFKYKNSVFSWYLWPSDQALELDEVLRNYKHKGNNSL